MQSCSEHSKQKYWRRFTEKSQTCNQTRFIMGPSLFHLHSLSNGLVCNSWNRQSPTCSESHWWLTAAWQRNRSACSHPLVTLLKDRTVQIQDNATSSSASLQGSKLLPCKVTAPLPGSAQLSWDATAHGQWGHGHGDILPPPGPYTRFPS